MIVPATRVTPGGFSVFGKVVLTPDGPPTSQGADYKFWSDLAHYRIGGETEIGICRVFAQHPARVEMMERHLRSPEIVIPIDAPLLVPLMLDGMSVAAPRVFRVEVGEAIVVEERVWHGACLPFGRKESSYFVIFRRGTPHEDVVKKAVEPFEIAAA
jgi:ureidoglycolate hydrolase